MRLKSILPITLVILLAAMAQCQQITVQPEAGKTVTLEPADLDSLPHLKITAEDHGTPSTFEGVALKAVLDKAGVGFGETLKGKRMAAYLLVEAADGYRVVFALPELDPAFGDKQVILAFLKDGKSLAGKEGPYRIIVPDEKRMARWVKQVTALRILEAP